LEPIGVGTERLQDALAGVFPNHVVARLDRDTAAKEGVEEVLARLRRKEIDILVGTQMVTKGHDIPGVTLVGVILADQSLAFPDFRASERTFQLLSQVAGRAGRGEKAGRVLLQTYQPRHEAIVHAMQHDYEGFYAGELTVRNDLGYPPYSRLVAVRCDAADEDEARSVATLLGDLARAHPAALSDRVTVLGPAPAPIARIRARYRFRLLMRSADRAALRAVAETLVQRIEAGIGAARASVDVDPYSML
jgi:primosomal protein N' (replication factor Y)